LRGARSRGTTNVDARRLIMANEQRPQFKQGDVCHFELPVSDNERAKRFYGKVFGWQFQEDPQMHYVMISTPGKTVGGGFLSPTGGMPFKVTNYIYVESIDETLPRFKEMGGKLVKEKTEVGGAGYMLHFEDTEGNLLALWQAK
jgi:predicted enzyme related to lactoylglutathione lyase